MARRHRRKSNLLVWFLLFALPATVIVGAAWLFILDALTPKPDKVTHCYEQEDQHQAAILVQYSIISRISPSQIRTWEGTLQEAYEDLPPNGKLSVYWFGPGKTSSKLKPALEICRPAKNRDELNDIADKANQSGPQLKREGEEATVKFEAFTSDLLEKGQADEQQNNYSPLLDQVKAISEEYEETGLHRLYVLSDGISTGRTTNFCFSKNHLIPYPKWKETAAYQFFKPTHAFFGTEITFVMTEWAELPGGDAKYCRHEEIRSFWQLYFEDAGAIYGPKYPELGVEE